MKTPFHRARVVFDFRKLGDAALASFGDGVASRLTGGAPFTSPPVAPAALSALAGDLRGVLAQIASGGRTKALSTQLAAARKAILLALIANGHYVEDTANTAAAGDMAKAVGLIQSVGYALVKAPAKGKRTTGVAATGPGWVHFRVVKGAKIEAHLWRAGVTPAKGTPPTTLVVLVTLEVDLVLRDLPSGSIVAIQHASVGQAAKGTAAMTGPEVTTIPASLGKHPLYSMLQTNPYAWSDFTYIQVP